MAAEVYKRAELLAEITPDTIRIRPSEGFIDSSKSILEAFEDTMFALVSGGVSAVFVVFIFMRRTAPR